MPHTCLLLKSLFLKVSFLKICIHKICRVISGTICAKNKYAKNKCIINEPPRHETASGNPVAYSPSHFIAVINGKHNHKRQNYQTDFFPFDSSLIKRSVKKNPDIPLRKKISDIFSCIFHPAAVIHNSWNR